MVVSRKKIVHIGTLIVVFAFVVLVAPPMTTFDEPRIVVIEEGTTMIGAATLLKENGIVYSSTLARIVSFVRNTDTRVQAGEYFFEEPLGAWEAVVRIATGVYGVDPVRVRLPEGLTRQQMADILLESLPDFDKGVFLSVTEDKEGYLFPDTYFFLPTISAEGVAIHLEEAFFEQMNRLEPQLILSGRTLEEIVIMASIIEREAYKPEDQRLISGVLWNRMKIGMALQVDATLYYLLGKPSSELTLTDLEIDSPYNTYEYPGLPPTPIANPGLTALEAALSPTPSEYLYYLSDEDGVTHYAETFEGHKENKNLYLR